MRYDSARPIPFPTLVLAAAAVLVSGCEAGDARLPAFPGWTTARAAERPWRLEAARAGSSEVDARRVLKLEEPSMAAWGAISPDGRLYAAQAGWLAIRDLESGEVTAVTAEVFEGDVAPGEGILASFSPDGGRVVFLSMTATERASAEYVDAPGIHLWVYDLETGTGSHLATLANMGWLEPYDWLPDGRTIVALGFPEDGLARILLISAGDGSYETLRTVGWDRPSNLAASPDGRWIAYDLPAEDEPEGPRDIFLLAVDGSRETRIVAHPANDRVLGWTPDGSRLLFASDRTGTDGAWLLPVADGAASGEPSLAQPDLWNLARPAGFSEDGRFFYTVESSSPGVHLATLDESGSGVTEAPSRLELSSPGTARFPAWSPDGRWLAYLMVEDRNNPTRLVLRDVSVGEVRELPVPDSVSYAGGLGWSADGELLLLSRDRNRATILRMDPRTGALDEVHRVAPGHETLYRFHPDPTGNRVAAIHWITRDGTIVERDVRMIDLDDGSVEILEGGPGEDPTYRINPALSPDGRRLAFFEWRDVLDEREGSTWALVLADLTSGEAADRLVFAAPPRGGVEWSVAWSPDGANLFYTHPVGDADDPRLRELRRVAVDGGEPVSLGLVEADILSLAVHPDGRRIAFDAGIRRHELWVLEGLPGSGARVSAGGGDGGRPDGP